MSVAYRGKKLAKTEFDILEDIQQETGKISTTPECALMDSAFGLTIEGGHLTKLTLHGCDLKVTGSITPQIIEKICTLPNLKSLGFYLNHLFYIPDCIGDLKTLKYLSLQDNHLTALPDSIGKLTSLEKLDLDMNQIASLPDSFANLQSLQVLNLCSNNFSTFPEVLTKLKSLVWLNISSNKIKSIPESIENIFHFKIII